MRNDTSPVIWGFSIRKSWMKTISIISGIALVIAIGGLIFAGTTPANVEKEVALVSYTHQGNFDYVAYINPSYLLGPEPIAELPETENPIYFTSIIDEIEMSFRFVRGTEAAKKIEITAIIESPDLWAVELYVEEPEIVNAASEVKFPFDIEMFNEEFDKIDEEIGISSTDRHITIVADVATATNSYSYSLPVIIQKKIIEIDKNIVQTQGDAVGIFGYEIYLNDNSIYPDSILYAPGVETETEPIFTKVYPGEILYSKLTNSMDISFSYNFISDHPVSNLTEDVTVNAVIVNPSYWEKSITLVPTTRYNSEIKTDFSINLNEINELLQLIRDETGVASQEYNLRIEAIVDVNAQTESGPIHETFRPTMQTAIGQGTIEWTQDLNTNKTGEITTTVSTPKYILNMKVTELRAFAIILDIFFLSIFTVSIYVYLKYFSTKHSSLEKQLEEANKRYGDIIAVAEKIPAPGNDDTIIEMKSLEGLANIANEMSQLILYSQDNNSHYYCVINQKTRYQYILE